MNPINRKRIALKNTRWIKHRYSKSLRFRRGFASLMAASVGALALNTIHIIRNTPAKTAEDRIKKAHAIAGAVISGQLAVTNTYTEVMSLMVGNLIARPKFDTLPKQI